MLKKWWNGRRNPLPASPIWLRKMGEEKEQLATVTAQVDESPGWATLTGRPHDYDPAQVQELYADALTAWRKNPIAWRIVAITTDYLVGDHIRVSSPVKALNEFIQCFWDHPLNRMDLRLEGLSDELARSGDLFIALFLNRQDGMSYLRMVTKDRICQIVTASNDWEMETEYHERLEDGSVRVWHSPVHPAADGSEAVMLHYSVNRPVGALLGEGDLTSMLPWLQRYSRLLEDRVRLHWAVRSFLWFVTVPTNMVKSKQEQYRHPPESGSIVVKDEAERWEAGAPDLKGADARYDLQAVRGMIDAGSGYPPHWRGEAGDANLATATAMQGPTERHLLRRQQYFSFILQDLLYHAYQRAQRLGLRRRLPYQDYDRLFTVITPEISRWDNESVARAAREMATALGMLKQQLPGESDAYLRTSLESVMRVAGMPATDELVETILREAKRAPSQPPLISHKSGEGEE